MNRRDLLKRLTVGTAVAASGLVLSDQALAVGEEVTRRWWALGRWKEPGFGHFYSTDFMDTGVFTQYSGDTFRKTITAVGFDYYGEPAHLVLSNPDSGIAHVRTTLCPGYHHFTFDNGGERIRIDLVRIR